MGDARTVSSMTDPAFKVIIVGAGVAGLTLALCLEKANIDWVLLDKGIVAPPFGTTITLQPHGCRILHQLGCLDEVLAHCSTMGKCYARTPSGKCYLENNFFPVVAEHAGYDTRTLDRQAFLRILYNNISDKSKVLERHRVESVIEEDSMVRVILSDGQEFVGDLVVGTDGVHSKMREIMWNNANQKIPGYITAEEKRSMKTTYQAIVAWCPPLPGFGKHDMHIISNDKFSFLLLDQPEFISYIVHCKLPESEQCRWPTRRKYTEADLENLAAKLADQPVSDTMLFGEIWKARTRAQLISLEEGCLEHWFFGRTALAGDAIHKVTPNSALGGCTAMEGVVSLANAIYAAIHAHPNKKPTDVEIKDALQGYQDGRLGRVKEIVKAAGDLTRLQAYDGWYYYIMQRWVTPIIGLDFLAKNIAKLCSGAPKLTYVPFEEERGKLGWMDSDTASVTAQQKKQVKKNKPWEGEVEKLLPKIFAALGLFTVVLWMILSGGSDRVPGFGAKQSLNGGGVGSNNITVSPREYIGV